MKKSFLILILMSLTLMLPLEAFAKKRRRAFKRKWSISLVNGYSFYEKEKQILKLFSWSETGDGQMSRLFSSLEIARNFGYYEIGAKIQNTGPSFVSPFVKWNMNKNNSRSSIVPSLTAGFSPSNYLGAWARLGIGLTLNRYVSISPFVGVYAYYRLSKPNVGDRTGQKMGVKSINHKRNIFAHAGLRINLYY